MKSSIDDLFSTASLIRKLRQDQRMSQKQLAALAGVSFSFVNQVEGGKETIRLDAANKILKVFGYEMAPRLIQSSQVMKLKLASEPTEVSKSGSQKKTDWAFFT